MFCGYNYLMPHSDRLYLRCTFCQNFVLLCRTNDNTRLFSDWVAVEAFLKEHLRCNPFHSFDNLCGMAGFEVVAWSAAEEESKNHTIELPGDLLDMLNE